LPSPKDAKIDACAAPAHTRSHDFRVPPSSDFGARQVDAVSLHEAEGLLRSLAKRSYEIRVHLQWRIVLIHDGDSLVAFDLMNHDEITAWLRGR
jgi:plasmid maintenance system killer protein